MTTNKPVRAGKRVTTPHDPAFAPVDIFLAEARRLRAEALTRLLQAGLSRCRRVIVSMFGWQRAADPKLYQPTNLTDYVKALRSDTKESNKNRWLGHGA